MSNFEEYTPSTGGSNLGRISSMQQYSDGMGGGGQGAENNLSFGVESNIIQAIGGSDPKGGSLVGILTMGVSSAFGIDFNLGLCGAAIGVGEMFGLPRGPNIGLPNLNFGLTKGGGKSH